MNDLTLLAQHVGQQLLDKKVMLSTAESCTGGLVASTVIEIAGSSQWFERGFVTYTNQAKMDELGVAETTLMSYGAVSEETAREMACGVLAQINRTPSYVGKQAHWAVSTTGVAGPTGGTAAKPVGMVCFGIACLKEGAIQWCHTYTMHFKGDRTAIRQQAVAFILNQVVQQLNRA
ncbi:MAG: CinA family protein [Pelistega sp.]|nr:CinA family protein [Pelistega sp.]